MSIPSGWEVVIGIETHVQLNTNSKIFSNASTAFGAAPNTQASVVDLALPGTLPVMNAKAVECAIKFGLAVNDGDDKHIARRSVFARKNYFYPDLPKGYQISQFELPVVTGGYVDIQIGADEDTITKRIQLTRAHLEEDAGKSLHKGLETPGVSGIDLNRAGTPLLEIVSEPEMRSAAEAVAYARTLHGIVTWINICDGNMQEGSYRCDANVSVRRPGEVLGTRCEIKNLNSFRFMERAINYEVRRQIELIEDGGTVIQQTRLYDADRDETRAMRSKEDAMDYRYFPDPDLLSLVISEAEIEAIRDAMMLTNGQLSIPSEMAKFLQGQYQLSVGDARILASDLNIYIYFRDLLSNGPKINGIPADVKLCANFTIGEFKKKRNESDESNILIAVHPDTAARLLCLVYESTISMKTAKDLFGEFWDYGVTHGASYAPPEVDRIINERSLRQISDAPAIEKLIDEILATNAKSVAEFKAGKEKALQAIVGQVMKASKGKANPAQVNTILKAKLEGE